METSNPRQNRLNNWCSLNFKLGIATCLTLVVIGLILASINGVKDIEQPAVPLNQLPQLILKPDAAIFITLGILILLLTPILQVIIALVTFSIDRDKRYLGISITLLCILAIGCVLALA